MQVNNFEIVPFLRTNQVKDYLIGYFRLKQRQLNQDRLTLVQLEQIEQILFSQINQSPLIRANLIALQDLLRIINSARNLSVRSYNFNEKLLAQIYLDLNNRFGNILNERW